MLRENNGWQFEQDFLQAVYQVKTCFTLPLAMPSLITTININI